MTNRIAIFAVALCMLFCLRAIAGEQAPDTMQARLLGCAACHGAHGEGTDNDYFPRLAGKPSGYLYNQLLAFRDGRRKYPPMNYLLAYLPDAYLRQIAEYFATEHPPFTVPAHATVDAQTLTLGYSLVNSGDRARGVPACVSCHGAALSGRGPAIPGLLGLHADYISAQLGAWRYGTRRAASPDCMHVIATRLSESEISAIAAWLASQPMPSNSAAAAPEVTKMPLACGSVPH